MIMSGRPARPGDPPSPRLGGSHGVGFFYNGGY